MLSSAEIRVKDLVVRGRSNIEASKELNVSEKTVKFHLTNIFKKSGVSSRAELISLELGGYRAKEKEAVLNGIDHRSNAVEVVQKTQEQKIQFIDDKFHVGQTIDQLHGMMKEVTKDSITPSTVNAACNCVARLNETINTAITAARFLNER